MVAGYLEAAVRLHRAWSLAADLPKRSFTLLPGYRETSGISAYSLNSSKRDIIIAEEWVTAQVAGLRCGSRREMRGYDFAEEVNYMNQFYRVARWVGLTAYGFLFCSMVFISACTPDSDRPLSGPQAVARG